MSGYKAGAFMTEALRNGQHPAIGSQVRVPKMGELVASSLRRQIVRGDLAEGDALPSESELMQQFGVSRPTLREAFRVLESESLISVRRGAHGGAVVHVPNGDVAARYAALVLEHRGGTSMKHAALSSRRVSLRSRAPGPRSRSPRCARPWRPRAR